ncbi:SNF2 helicase associated domain-containing protein [Neobacillus sp. SM06]|uniref:SNF2 helicase associated domain-containing protein n=1 Tax=Neobacillus sp. SM06 TaxID=3422492 RepID=UPI003D2A49FE
MGNLLTERTIKDLVTDAIYRRGNSYFRQGRVRDLFFDFSRGIWHAKVKGSKTYKVEVRINEDGIEGDCNCPAFDQYWHPCKHITAVLLEILDSESSNSEDSETYSMYVRQQERDQERQRELMKERQRELIKQQQERQNQYVKQLTEQFIQSFALSRQETVDSAPNRPKEPLLVEWICKITKPYYTGKPMISIEMKVGLKRPYVVKKIKEFLKTIQAQNQYVFTKNFTYDPTEHKFIEEDEEIIQLLQNALKQEEIYQELQSSHFYYASSTDERYLILSPMIADEVLRLLEKGNVRFENRDNAFDQIELRDSELPLALQLDKGKQAGFQLDLSEFLFLDYLEHYGYVLKDNVFNKLTIKQQAIIKEVTQLVAKTNNPLLPIDQNQIEPFLTHVAPKINTVGNLKIASSISNQIMKFPLEAKVFVDHVDGLLHVSLEYHYGENKIDPFEPSNENNGKSTIIVRDAEKEQAIMDLMESADLKFNGELLYVNEEEGMFDFLFETLPQLEDKAEIYLTNRVKSVIFPKEHAPVTTVDVDSSGNWLDISFTMDGIGEEDIQNILQNAVEKKKFYRLPNGAFVSLETEEFQTIQNIMAEFHLKPSHLKKDSLKLPLYRGMQLEELAGQNQGNVKYGKQFRRLLNRIKNPEELEFEVPESLHAELRDYQNYGFQWLSMLKFYQFGGILADDMGLGKTLQSIAFLLSEKERTKQVKPALIVAPASLIYNWKNEFQKFAPSLSVEVVAGAPQERMDMLQQAAVPDVWITSYPTLRQDIEHYAKHAFHTMILDEAQTIKNYATKAAKAVRDIQTETCFALSGTPIENSVDELWSIFQTIMPDFFPSQKVFRQLEPEKIAKMIRPFLLRRVKKDVLKELPDKIETVDYSELSKEQKALYLAYLERIQAETKESLQGEGFQKSRIKILAGLTRLRQLCCHPSLFLENYQGDSGKLEQLMEIVGNAVENGRRLLIFSQFTSMLSIIRLALADAGLSFFYLDGQTPSKERVQMVDQFNQGEATVFLLSLKAGNTGLNLTGADTVILYDLWWNPAVEEQAAGRAHRMGQKNVVQVIRMIAQGTIEEKIYELQQNKRELIETLIQPGDQALSRLTEEDIREILSI